MKMGAFVSMAGAMALALALPASAQLGGPGSLVSTLTATTTTQQLTLTTTVTQNSPSSFTWTFQLFNPSGNTVQIRSFTAAPFADLTGVTGITDPPGWTHEVFAFSPQINPTLENNKVNWFVGVSGNQSLFLLPGGFKVFSFVLNRGADPNFRGKAGALDTFGFSGDTLGSPPPPLPQGGGGTPGHGIPVRQHGPFYLAEAYPALVQDYGQHSGISADSCFLNGATQAPTPTVDAVPGILCLAKRVNAVFNNPFAICDSTLGETNPRVQAVNLNKIIPGSFKCNAYGMPKVDPNTGAISPAQTLFQDANHLRTWWTLRYTQAGTKFVLDVVVVCTGHDGAPSFHIDRWVWIVVADTRTFPYVVDLLHQDAVGTFEIPCILAEDVVSVIRSEFSNLSTAVNQNDRNGIFDDLINLEFFISVNCLMVDVAMPEAIFPGPHTISGPSYQPPGNQALIDSLFGTGRNFGILDTFEHPCCCKLLADLEFIGQQTGISFGPHTFLRGAPI